MGAAPITVSKAPAFRSKMREKLLEHKREFYRSSLEQAKKNKVKAVILTAPHDPARIHELARVL